MDTLLDDARDRIRLFTLPPADPVIGQDLVAGRGALVTRNSSRTTEVSRPSSRCVVGDSENGIGPEVVPGALYESRDTDGAPRLGVYKPTSGE